MSFMQNKKTMAQICLPIVAITIALLMVVSISTVAAPQLPVSAKLVNSGSNVIKAKLDTRTIYVFIDNNNPVSNPSATNDQGSRDTVPVLFL